MLSYSGQHLLCILWPMFQENDECQWFTFFGKLQHTCVLFANCTAIDTTNCDQCVSGERECQPLACFVQGQCEGLLDFGLETNSATECLDVCQSFDQCTWFTYKPEVQLCLLYQTCTTLDETCTTCISGQQGCHPRPSGN